MKGLELFEYNVKGEWIPYDKLKRKCVRPSEIRGVRGQVSSRASPVADRASNVSSLTSEEEIEKIPPRIERIPP